VGSSISSKALIEWNEALTIDQGLIDRDHKHLFSLTDQLYSAIKLGFPKAGIETLLNDYIEFIALHFSHEEMLMESIRYPDIERHVLAHNVFFEKVCNLRTQYKRNDKDIAGPISAYIGTYTFNHIDIYDRKLAEYCQSMPRSAG